MINQKIDERIPCPRCKKTFASGSSLSHHKKRCKKLTSDEEVIEKIKEQYEREKLEILKSYSNKEQKLQNKINELKKKKLKITNTNYVCNYCNHGGFTSISGLTRHMKLCLKRTDIAQENILLKQKIVELEIDKNKLEKQNDRLENDKDIINKDKDKFADIATTNNNYIKTSISAMKYFMTHFHNTPALEPIEDLSSIKIEFKDDRTFIHQLISVYRNENLAAFIGEYILNIYKKTDSSKQSLWSSDVDRLTYIIREAAAKDKNTWITDKKGIKVGERVIKPALDYIKPLLQAFVVGCKHDIVCNNYSGHKIMDIVEYQKLSNHILTLIDNGVLEKDIIKYLAPNLYWNKNIQVESEKIKKIECDDIMSKIKNSKPPKNAKIINVSKKKTHVKQRTKKSIPC